MRRRPPSYRAGMSSPATDTALADVFVMLADSLRSGYDTLDTLDLLVEASTTFTSAVEAGILLADAEGRLHVAASSTERSAAVEEAQMGVNGGPCAEAIQAGTTVDVPVIEATRGTWPEFVATARARGFLAAHAIPLRLRSQTLGGLNLFSARTGALSDGDQALAEALAQIATISIVQHQTVTEHGLLNAQLQRALDSRIVIEQAKGVISQQRAISIDSAFALLRSHARSSSTGLKQIANQVVNDGFVI
jgi:GAF domain-containing protein